MWICPGAIVVLPLPTAGCRIIRVFNLRRDNIYYDCVGSLSPQLLGCTLFRGRGSSTFHGANAGLDTVVLGLRS
jgi:hypothetical protein